MFDHLWFLWFLCWLIPLFVCAESLLRWLGISAGKIRLFQLNASIWWMVPITLFPQLLMGTMTPRMHFGPDTSLGILPQPHLLVYYTIFFGFGMSMFISGEKADRLGRWWPWHLLGGLSLFSCRPRYHGQPSRHCSSTDTFCMVDVFWIHWNVPKMVLSGK